ncbi:hypothetical protein [Acinetobacter sp.]|uniref:hypothetical protein n=1 Tax=Acinetobacter sp. TaxID=472 RepID=UPI002584AAAE|nr:hypothetical protein [Acinetobacter sp.]
MNVNLAEHQRSVLTTMGIDLWIPKVGVQTRHYQNALYRDVALAEQDVIASFEFSQPNTAQPTIEQLRIVDKSIQTPPEKILHGLENQSEVSLLKRNNQTQQTEEITSSEQIRKQTALNIEPIQHIEAFEIQAFCTEYCLIVVDCTQITIDQKSLWANIQRAVSGQYFDLKWPFPMLQFQDGKGAAMYTQGFIDSLKQERKLIGLGQLPYLQNSDLIQLASLQEMIDQPILKRRLWQFMQNKMS